MTGKRRTLDTGATRRRIQQLVRNVFPKCEAKFVDPKKLGGLSFGIVDHLGTMRASRIDLLPHLSPALTKSWLLRQMEYTRGPKGEKARLG